MQVTQHVFKHDDEKDGRRSRARFDSLYRLSNNNWFNEQEMAGTGYRDYVDYRPRYVNREGIAAISYDMFALDLYILTIPTAHVPDDLFQRVKQQSRFGAWTTRTCMHDGFFNGRPVTYEVIAFIFREPEDAIKFRLMCLY